jgi:hypothetical protein
MAKDSSEYFKVWYERNREEFLARRRERYSQDSDYAERQRQYTKDSRVRKKEGVETHPENTLNDLARALDVSTGTLRYWLKQEYMPMPPRTEAGRYSISDDALAIVQRAFSEIGGRLKPTNIEKFQGLIEGLKEHNWGSDVRQDG